MINLTREQAIAEHRKMWNWIADEIEKKNKVLGIWNLKDRYCEIKGFELVLYNCFLCEYTKANCVNCPIDWKNDSAMYMCERNGGLWVKCRDAETWQEQAALARQIANLPERTDV